jgi:hypothetical protein
MYYSILDICLCCLFSVFLTFVAVVCGYQLSAELVCSVCVQIVLAVCF